MTTDQARPVRRPEDDIAFAVAFWLFGIAVAFWIPWYFGLGPIGTRICYWSAYFFYAFGFVGAATWLQHRTRKEAFSDLGPTAALIVLAIATNFGAQSTEGGWSSFLRVLTAVFGFIAIYGGTRGLARLFLNERDPTDPRPTSRRLTKTETIIGLIVALATLATAIVQLLEKAFFS